MVTGPMAYAQCALLYTNSNGERRIRWAIDRTRGAHGSHNTVIHFSYRGHNMILTPLFVLFVYLSLIKSLQAFLPLKLEGEKTSSELKSA